MKNRTVKSSKPINAKRRSELRENYLLNLKLMNELEHLNQTIVRTFISESANKEDLKKITDDVQHMRKLVRRHLKRVVKKVPI
jgi:hypothetical protein